MRRWLVLWAATIALAGCGSDADPAEPSSATGSTSRATGASRSTGASGTSAADADPETYDAEGCPVSDDAFCTTALEVVEALQAGDADALFELSRDDRLVCAEVATEYFPDCVTDDTVLKGHGLSGPDFVVEVVDADAYRGRLDALVNGIDPSFTDELGDGDVRLIGVGTCGPDSPGRRTYHLAWTAASGERMLGSFELTFEDDEWQIALWYLGSLEEWEAEQANPLQLAFCEAGLSPWVAA